MQTVVGFVVALMIVAGAFFFFSTRSTNVLLEDYGIPTGAVLKTQQSNKIEITDGVERWYTNDTRTFSFRLPDGFSAPELDIADPGVEGMMLHMDGYEPLVVLVHQVPPLFALSDQSIRANLPGITVTGVRETFLGTVTKALVFRTYSAEQEEGIELWAINNGKLYRLATSPENEDLLKFVTENWYFAPPFPTTK